MGFRTNLINKNAVDHLQPGEEVEQVAIVRAADGGGNFAVAATPSHVYVFALSGLSKIDETVARIPIGKALVERRSSFLTVGRRGQEKPEHVFSTLPGGGPKRLVAYVAERGR